MGILKLSLSSAVPFLGAALLFFMLCLAAPARAQVVREDAAYLNGVRYPRVYRWSDPLTKPKAVVIAVHGATLHGLIFDVFANHLAGRGVVVLAPDLRGFGRWLSIEDIAGKARQSKAQVAYDQSRQDLISLIAAAKSEYPDLPLYCLGESLGAGIALYAAAEEPYSVDGLILSSPTIKCRFALLPRVFKDAAKALTNPLRQVNLIPYLKEFVSNDNDPRIVAETINDPLVRKKLSAWDLLKTVSAIRPTLKYADRVGSSMPVLLIQGRRDKMLKSKAVVELLARLHSADQTVKWFKDRGHLMLETTYVHPEVVQTVDRWLDDHIFVGKSVVQISDSSSRSEFPKSSFNQSEQN